MAVIKTIGGFSKYGRYYFKIKIANELWSFTRSKEKQTQLFFFGWYTLGGSIKLWTFGVPFISFQFAINDN